MRHQSPYLFAFALLGAALGIPAPSRAANSVAGCQRAVGKAGSFLVRAVLKAEQTCLGRRAKGALPPQTICADQGPSVAAITNATTKGTITHAVAKARGAIAKKCSGVDVGPPLPAGLGVPTTCPRWEPACSFAVRDLATFQDCLECTHLAAAQALVATQYSDATGPLPPPGATVLHVHQASGSDGAGCGTEAHPCQSVQQAVSLAASGGEIRVGEGTYAYSAGVDTCSGAVGETAVVCILNKDLTIRGGFTPADWSMPDRSAHPTIIDGQDGQRGVLVVRTAPTAPAAGLVLEGVTITRGRVQGGGSGDDSATFAFGGGMLADRSRIVLRDVVFSDNQAIGGDTGAGYGGAGAGGGLALRAAPSGTLLDNVTFLGNVARGGNGPGRGGYGIGGGLFTSQSTVTGQSLVFGSNLAVAGNSPGGGTLAGELADAQGGGAAIGVGSTATLDHVRATGNQATGGAAGTDGGGAFGGGLYAELATLAVADSEVAHNVALGGDAANGGIGAGGGVMGQNAAVTLDRTFILDNRSTGGAGSTNRGPAGGGGVYLSVLAGNAASTVVNSIIAANLTELGAGGSPAAGGGGGGLFLQGVQAAIEHATVAGNHLGSSVMQGSGMVLLSGAAGARVSVSYGIVADHTDPAGAAALHVQPGSTLTLTRGIFAGNANDTNASGSSGPSGTFVGLGTMLAFASVDFVAPDPPSFDYHITRGSPAIDQAIGSTETVDIDGDPRIGTPDIGADEAGAA